MKVSIISAVYNKEMFIEEHVKSLLNQDYKDIEFIFVNDGSTDNSFNIVKKYQNDPRVKLISQKNQGQSIARRNGFLNSTGDLIYFVDCDDKIYDSEVISNLVKIFKRHKDIDFVIGQIVNSYDRKDSLDKIIYSKDVKEGLYGIDYLYDKSFRFSLAYKLIKRDKIKPDYFISTIAYEDALLTYKIYNTCKGFYYYASPIYIVNRKSYNKRVTNSLNAKHVTEKYQNIKTIAKLSNFAISVRRLSLQSYLDDLNYALRLNYKDKKTMLELAKNNLDKANLNKTYLIDNSHYKRVFRYRFFYSKSLLNLLISSINRLFIFIKIILLTIIKALKKIIVFPFNFLSRINKKGKMVLYKIKYGSRLSVGKNITFRKSFIINIAEDGQLNIGDNNFFNNYCTINCHNNISIGNDNIFGENVKFYDHDHKFNDLTKNMKNTFNNGKIVIGNDNWLGSNVVVLKDTKLGNHNVVGAGVILKGDFNNYKIIKNDRTLVVEDIEFKN